MGIKENFIKFLTGKDFLLQRFDSLEKNIIRWYQITDANESIIQKNKVITEIAEAKKALEKLKEKCNEIENENDSIFQTNIELKNTINDLTVENKKIKKQKQEESVRATKLEEINKIIQEELTEYKKDIDNKPPELTNDEINIIFNQSSEEHYIYLDKFICENHEFGKYLFLNVGLENNNEILSTNEVAIIDILNDINDNKINLIIIDDIDRQKDPFIQWKALYNIISYLKKQKTNLKVLLCTGYSVQYNFLEFVVDDKNKDYKGEFYKFFVLIDWIIDRKVFYDKALYTHANIEKCIHNYKKANINKQIFCKQTDCYHGQAIFDCKDNSINKGDKLYFRIDAPSSESDKVIKFIFREVFKNNKIKDIIYDKNLANLQQYDWHEKCQTLSKKYKELEKQKNIVLSECNILKIDKKILREEFEKVNKKNNELSIENAKIKRDFQILKGDFSVEQIKQKIYKDALKKKDDYAELRDKFIWLSNNYIGICQSAIKFSREELAKPNLNEKDKQVIKRWLEYFEKEISNKFTKIPTDPGRLINTDDITSRKYKIEGNGKIIKEEKQPGYTIEVNGEEFLIKTAIVAT